MSVNDVEFDFGLQKYVVLDTGRTVTYIVIDRKQYKIDIIKNTRRITMNLKMKEFQELQLNASMLRLYAIGYVDAVKTYRCL